MTIYDNEADQRGIGLAYDRPTAAPPIAWDGIIGGRHITKYGDTPLTYEQMLEILRTNHNWRNTGTKIGGITQTHDDPTFWQAINPNATEAERQAQAAGYRQYQQDIIPDGKKGVRGWIRENPVGTIAAFVAAAAGGAALAGGLGGGAGAGAGAGAGTGAGAGAGAGTATGGLGAGFGTNAGGLGIFANGGTAGMAGVGGGNAGLLAASGGITGGAGAGFLGGAANAGRLGLDIRRGAGLAQNLFGGAAPQSVEAPVMNVAPGGMLGNSTLPAMKSASPLDQRMTQLQGFHRKPIQYKGTTIWI